VTVKGIRALRQAFPRDFREEIHALRQDLARVGSHYVRRPAVWLTAGFVWWCLYVLLLLLCGIGKSTALNAILEITFGITGPPLAITQAYGVDHAGQAPPPFIKFVGMLGWSLIAMYTLLIPAVVALILERLPNLVASLRGLAPSEVWEFLKHYAELQHSYTSTVIREPQVDRKGGDIERIAEVRRTALQAIASLVTYWYRGGIDLNTNASFMRLWKGSEYPDAEAAMLYSNAVARDAQHLLELDGWAYPHHALPQTLLLNVDRDRPRAGGPYAVIQRTRDVVSNTLDAAEWRRRDANADEVGTLLEYFGSVPFRSFFSIPVFDLWDPSNRVIGVLSVQVDQEGVFVAGNPDTEDLVALISQLCYFLAWLEKTRNNAPEPLG
jgi:hypothetical protein